MDTAIDKVDSEIAAIRTQIDALRHRRSLLSATLLSSRKIHLRLDDAKSTAFPARSPQALDARSLMEEQALAVLSCNARATCGITAMRVQDPDPNAINGGKVLGIRIDVFSAGKNQFLAPYHLFFHEVGKPDALRLHKHTIPPFIPLQSLLRRYMPDRNAESEDGDGSGNGQDFPLFLRFLRQELVSHAKRLDAVEKLKSACVGKGRPSHKIIAVTAHDPGTREVEVEWEDGAVAKLRIGLDGSMVRTVVRSKEGPGAGRRRRRLERLILGGGGHVNGLPLRLMRDAASG